MSYNNIQWSTITAAFNFCLDYSRLLDAIPNAKPTFVRKWKSNTKKLVFYNWNFSLINYLHQGSCDLPSVYDNRIIEQLN